MDFKLRRGTTEEWAAANPVLPDGVMGFDRTLGNVKIGDGVKTWTQLNWAGGAKGDKGDTGNTGATGATGPAFSSIYTFHSDVGPSASIQIHNGYIDLFCNRGTFNNHGAQSFYIPHGGQTGLPQEPISRAAGIRINGLFSPIAPSGAVNSALPALQDTMVGYDILLSVTNTPIDLVLVQDLGRGSEAWVAAPPTTLAVGVHVISVAQPPVNLAVGASIEYKGTL